MLNFLTSVGIGAFIAGSAFLSTHLGLTGPTPDTNAHASTHAAAAVDLNSTLEGIFSAGASSDSEAETSGKAEVETDANVDASANADADADTDFSLSALLSSSIH